jgi:hypothetical protein
MIKEKGKVSEKVTVNTEDPYWDGFAQGAGEVWDAVEPLLHQASGSTITGLDRDGNPKLLTSRRP